MISFIISHTAMQQDLLVAERQVDVPLQRLHDVSFCSQGDLRG